MDTFSRQCIDMVVPSAGFLLILLFLAGCFCNPVHRGRSANYTALNQSDYFEDTFLSTPKLVRKYGYPIETHVAITRDGYVLNLHRIPYGRHQDQNDFQSGDKPIQNKDILAKARRLRSSRRVSEKRRPSVLLVPGLLSTSSMFVLTGPQKGLAFVLADHGYDVWILNPRGSPYSMNHVKIPPSDDRFWLFSWHEIGMYDIPAALDLVTQRTGFRRVPVVGHSMGNTVMMVAGSMLPEVNDKVSLMVALAPAVYFRHARSPLMRSLATLVPALANMTDALGVHSLNFGQSYHKLLIQMCQEVSITQSVCKAVMSMSFGADPEQLDSTMLPVLLGHFPASSSINTVFHFGQLIMQGGSGEFQQFDYNLKRNMERYGSPTPPKYLLERVRFPVALVYGQNDLLSSVQDVDYLSKQLPNVVDMYRIPWPKFNHMDFLFAINARSLVFDHVLELVAKHGAS